MTKKAFVITYNKLYPPKTVIASDITEAIRLFEKHMFSIANLPFIEITETEILNG